MHRLLRSLDALRRSFVPVDASIRDSIAARLRWSYLISSTLPLLIVGGLLLNLSASARRESVYNDQQNLTSRITRNVSAYIADMHVQIENYTLVVRPGVTPLSQWQNAALDLEARNYPHLLDVAVIDSTGQELLRANRLQIVQDASLRDMSGDAAVQQALNEGRTTYSPVEPNEDAIRTFFLTLPLRNDAGKIIGAIQAEISAEPIAQELQLSTAGLSSYAYLISSDTGEVLIRSGAPDFRPPSDLAPLLDSAGRTVEYAGAGGQMVIGVGVPVTVRDENDQIGWMVVVEQPSSVAFAGLQRGVLLLAGLVVLVGVLALLWAFWQAQLVLRPLQALRQGAVAFGNGHLDHRILVSTNDELGDLARTFNQMADHLQQSLDQIERQNERLLHGLALARDIQVGLLPDHVPWGDVLEVYGRSIPAYEVGGDFYSYLALQGGRAAVAIGDISGKGVGAALLMALTSSAVESQSRQVESPAHVLTTLNQLLAPRLRASHMNAALLFVVFDPRQRKAHVANAGMISPVLITTHGSHFIEVGGLPVGAFPGASYQEETIELRPGDSLLLLSDGVVEARNADGEMFGFERLEQLIADVHPPGDMRSLVEVIINQVELFMDGAEQHDDITVVAVRPAVSIDAAKSEDEEQPVSYATV